MRQILFFLTIVISIESYSQDHDLKRDSLPIAEFEVSYDTTRMLDFKVVLITMRPISKSIAQYVGTKIWVQRISKGKITEKYLGSIDTEQGVYRPYSQPLNDTYIVVECGEYEGQVNLISKGGDFVTVPGYYYALNKPGLIYTRQSNLNDLIYKYDLKAKKGIDLRNKNVKVDNLLFEEVKGDYWVK